MFVVLAFADAIGIVLYLLLILIIPKGSLSISEGEEGTHATPSPKKTVFGNFVGATTILATTVTVIDNFTTIVNFVSGLAEPKSYPPNPPIPPRNDSWPIEPRIDPPPALTSLPKLYGIAWVQWSVNGSPYAAQIEMDGHYGSIVVNDASGQAVHQDASVLKRDGAIFIAGSDPNIANYNPDSFRLAVPAGGTWMISQACDVSGCYIANADASRMQLKY